MAVERGGGARREEKARAPVLAPRLGSSKPGPQRPRPWFARERGAGARLLVLSAVCRAAVGVRPTAYCTRKAGSLAQRAQICRLAADVALSLRTAFLNT